MIIDEEVYLAHHGVKGMRWGVRNEDRAAKKTAKREERAKKFDVKAKQLQTDIDTINARKASGKMRPFIANKKVRELTEERNKALTDAQRKREGKLSTTQKKVAIGASAAAAIIGTAVVYKTIQSGDHRRLAEKGKSFVTGKGIEFKKNPFLSDPNATVEQIQQNVVKGVNPEYGAIGTKMNCRRCTFAYELRRRGLDVEATRTTNASGQNAVGLLNATSPGGNVKATGRFAVATRAVREYKQSQRGGPTPTLDLAKTIGPGAKNAIESTTGEGIFRALATQPNRSRGELGVVWRQGGGHSMAYEIINGAPHIFDTQTGRTYSSSDALFRDLPSIAQAGFTRLDNVPLNPDYLLRWVKNA